MYEGFPPELVAGLRCPLDSGTLQLTAEVRFRESVRNGTLTCVVCQTAYPIAEGIATLFDPSTLDSVSRHELERRDGGAEKDNFEWERSTLSQMEVIPVMEALRPLKGMVVLELGCGKGRFTTVLAKESMSVIAVDFSLAVLRRLASRIGPGSCVGLVQGDCTKPIAATASVQRVLSTLVSNLPTSEHRRAMHRLAATALSPEGKFVFTAHHHGLKQRFRNAPQQGHYPESGIFRYLLRRSEIIEECGECFERIRCRPIQVTLPVLDRIGFQAVRISRVAERLPIVNQLGELLMAVGERPRQPR